MRWRHEHTATNPSSSVANLDQVEIITAPELTLSDALDRPGLWLMTNEVTGWFPQTAVSQDGQDAAEARPGGSRLSALVEGPGELSFWARQGGSQGAEIRVGSGNSVYLSGSWTRHTFRVPVGFQVVEWRFVGLQATDRFFVDQLEFTPAAAVSLAEAVDTPGRLWTTSADCPWVGAVDEATADAAYSGGSHHVCESWMGPQWRDRHTSNLNSCRGAQSPCRSTGS